MIRTRPELALLVAASGLALAACGGGGSKSHSASAPSSAPATSATAPATTGTGQQGGATSGGGGAAGQGGGSEPVRAPATLTGRGGQITPTSVHVPPYIAVEISLASADGRSYTLSVAGKTLSASSSRPTASVTLPGLRPGSSYTARPAGGGTAISVTPSAEPGP